MRGELDGLIDSAEAYGPLLFETVELHEPGVTDAIFRYLLAEHLPPPAF